MTGRANAQRLPRLIRQRGNQDAGSLLACRVVAVKFVVVRQV